MIRNPVSFNEATAGHTRRVYVGEYRCEGCTWRHAIARDATIAADKTGRDAFQQHLYDTWKRARDA